MVSSGMFWFLRQSAMASRKHCMASFTDLTNNTHVTTVQVHHFDGFSKTRYVKKLFTHVRITCTRSESARERIMALYKSYQQQHNNLLVVGGVVVVVIHSFYAQLPLAKRVRGRVSSWVLKPWQPNRVTYLRMDGGCVCVWWGGGGTRDYKVKK